ncbi:hypothetical protein KSP40_PGU006469 [Platanthera guangdongensis]|uniref:BRCT domain-containing protein n=1 Tax=Platanthera guangdongensis TaxID=2320717 RepID=A0ABR2MST0_9ASPA
MKRGLAKGVAVEEENILRKPSVSSDNDATFIAKRWRAAWISSSSLCEDWLLCGSGLSKEEKVLLDKFATMSGLVVTYQWKQNVTHLIAATNEDGACMRTMKYLMAILTGRWSIYHDNVTKLHEFIHMSNYIVKVSSPKF